MSQRSSDADQAHQLNTIARRQHGVLTREQLRSEGVTPRVERDRIAKGVWARRGRAIIILALQIPGDLHDAWLLQAEAGSTAIVSGPVAARLGGWQIEGADRIVVMTSHDKRAPTGVRVLRRENPAWPVQPKGLRLATPLDALADTAICRPFVQACSLIDQGLQQRWLNADDFDELIGHRAGHGRRGVGRLRQLRQRVLSGSRSEAEQRMAGILARLGVGRWRPNYPILNARGRVIAEIDFALVAGRTAIEVDGRAFHSDDLAFERDRVRQNELTMRGWTVLRFTWRQIVQEPHEVARIIRRAVAQAQVGEPTMYLG